MEQLQSILTDLDNKVITKHQAYDLILVLFDINKRYSLSYLDGQDFEQKTEVWAKDQDDALEQLEKICPNATYIFINRL